jgi:hypothetical protein
MVLVVLATMVTMVTISILLALAIVIWRIVAHFVTKSW